MKTSLLQCFKFFRIAMLIPVIALLMPAKQAVASTVDTCSASTQIDQEMYDTLDEVVCVVGDPSGLTTTVTITNSDADATEIVGIGAYTRVEAPDGEDDYDFEQSYSSEVVSNAFFVPTLDFTYTINGSASECVDPTNSLDTTYCKPPYNLWNYDFAEVGISAEVS